MIPGVDQGGAGSDRGGGPLSGSLAIDVVSAAPVIVLVLDPAGRLDYANPFFEALTGRALAEVRGADWFTTFLPARERPRIAALFRAVLAGEPARGGVHPIVTASGEERTIEWHDRVLRGPDGELTGLLSIGKDVSEQVLAEAALRASEANLREAQRLAGIGSWELDLVGGELRWSAEIYRIFELDAATFDASYEAFLALIHPDDRARVDAAYRRSVATREPYEVTHRLRLPDGRVKHVRERGETVYGSDGAPLRSMGTVQDVTAEVEPQLRLRRVLEAMGPFVGLCDLEGRLIEANREPLGARGEIDPDARTRPLWELYHFAYSPEVQAMMRAAFVRAAAGEVVRCDLKVRVDPETTAVYEGMLAPLVDGGGRVEGVICTGIDVSDRARYEEVLRTHSQVLVSMGEGVQFVDRDGIIRFANRALERMFGYDDGELVGRHVTVLNDADDAQNARIVAEIMGSIAACDRWEGTIRNRRRDGGIFYTRAVITRVERAGEVFFVSIQEDVTERRAAEREIRRTRDLLRRVIDASPDWIYVKDLDRRFLLVNQALARALGTTPEAMVGAVSDEGCPCRPGEEEAARGASARDPRVRLVHDGAARLFDALMSPLRGEDSQVYAVLGHLHDVTRAHAAEEELRRSLAEKEMLLREIHHRVKNNLQIISSLLHFHSKRVRDREDLAAFVDGRRRLLAMIIVHERLYKTAELSQIDFDGYLRDLVGALVGSCRGDAQVDVEVAADRILLPVEVALPCGMIVCELVTNVFKYAPAERRTIRARVGARVEGGRIVVAVDDDGVGFPAGFEPEAARSFGWSLVRSLVLQIDGEW